MMTTTPATEILARYTDEALTAAKSGPNRGEARAAEYLLTLDTPERRYRAHVDGTIRANVSGNRYADGVWESVNDLKYLIGQGTESVELKGEFMNRKTLEANRRAHNYRHGITD